MTLKLVLVMAMMAMHRRGNVMHCSELATIASEVSHRARREEWPGITASWASDNGGQGSQGWALTYVGPGQCYKGPGKRNGQK